MNNAGVMLYKNLKVPPIDLAGLMEEVNINVGGVIGMTFTFIDILTADKGTVINVSSALAFVPLPALPIYSATKAAVHAYTQSLRFQLDCAETDKNSPWLGAEEGIRPAEFLEIFQPQQNSDIY